jgi:hypothetical protein
VGLQLVDILIGKGNAGMLEGRRPAQPAPQHGAEDYQANYLLQTENMEQSTHKWE